MSETEELALDEEVLEQGIYNISDEPEVIQEANEEDELEEKIRRKIQKATQKRFDKLTYQIRSTEERYEQEKSELKAKIEALEADRLKEVAERNTTTLEQKRQDLLERRKEYLEIGDYDELNKVDEQLMDIKIQARQKPEPAKQEPKQEQSPESRQALEPEQPVNQALADWQSKNKWVFDQNQQGRLAKANKVFESVLADGYDIDEPETYIEIDKRLKREVPPPTGAPDRGQVTGNDRKFTEQDRKDMTAWGLDPTDVKARQLWIKNKG